MILITYASKYGSTKEVAEYIADQLRKRFVQVEIKEIKSVKNLNGYSGVILGTSVMMAKPLPASVKFVRKFRSILKNIPVAVFALSVTVKNYNVAEKETLKRFLLPVLIDLAEPVNLGLFGGKVDYKKLSWFWRLLARKDETGLMDEGDWRDWVEIRRWTDRLAEYFKS